MSLNLTNSASLLGLAEVGSTDVAGNYRIVGMRNPANASELMLRLEIQTGTAWFLIDEINNIPDDDTKWNFYENKTLVPITDTAHSEVLLECHYSLFIKTILAMPGEVKLAVNGQVTTKFHVVGELTIGLDAEKEPSH